MTYTQLISNLSDIVDYRRDELFGYNPDTEGDLIHDAAVDILAVYDAMLTILRLKTMSPKKIQDTVVILDDLREYSEMMARSWERDLLDENSIWMTDANALKEAIAFLKATNAG